jgi:metallo-beta-lactamase family protein
VRAYDGITINRLSNKKGRAMSAHADRARLLPWLHARPAPGRVCATHGEPVAADSLRLAIEERHGWPLTVPDDLESFAI